MTARLHYLPYSAATYSSQQTPLTGYGAANTGTTAIRQPWISSVTANGSNDDWIEWDFGAGIERDIVVAGLQSCLQGSGTLLSSFDGIYPPATLRGIISASTVVTAANGIRKGSFVVDPTYSGLPIRYLRVDFTNANHARGRDIYATYPSYNGIDTRMELGAMYLFGASVALPIDPLIDSEIMHKYPQGKTDLENGQVITWQRGAPKTIIRLRFRAAANHDIEQIARIAQAGVCWLDLGIDTRRDLQWPVRFVEDSHTRVLTAPRREAVTLTFEEVT